MEALLPTFIAVIFAETGSRVQRQAAALSMAFGGSGSILLALIFVSLVGLLTAGFAGVWVAEQLTYDARTMLLGFALIFSAAGVAWPKKDKVQALEGAPFLASCRKFAVAQFGDNSQFLVFAFAARGHAPAVAAISGVAAVLIAALLPYLFPEDWKAQLRLQFLRWGAAVALFLLGCVSILWALHAIG